MMLSYLGPLLFALLALSGCQKPKVPESGPIEKPKVPRGIEVGNGLTASYTTDFKVRLSYHPELDLHEVSQDEFYIDNESTASDGKKSVIYFHVWKQGRIRQGLQIHNLAELDRYLKGTFARTPFVSFNVGRLEGREHVHQTEQEFKGWYYLLTPAGDLVFARSEAVSAHQGLTRIPPIIGTLKYDDQPPRIIQLRAGPDAIPPGGIENVFFQAVDDLSGVAPHFGCTLISMDGRHELKIENPARRLENNWFSTRITPQFSLPPGEYYFREIRVIDRVGNSQILKASSPRDEFYSGNGGVRLAVLRVKMEKRIDDIKPPDVTAISLSTEVVAGGEGSLNFDAHDDKSGISTFRNLWSILVPCFPAKGRPEIRIAGTATPMDQGRFQVHYDVPRYLVPGRYFLPWLNVQDNAGNELNLQAGGPADSCQPGATYAGAVDGVRVPVAQMNLRNDGPIDTEKPRIYAVNIRSHAVKAGTPIVLKFRATDDLSGIQRSMDYGGRFEFVGPARDEAGSNFLVDAPVVRRLEDNWYELEVETEETMAKGEYVLREFIVTDNAGNYSKLSLSSPRQSETYDGGDKPIPVIRFNLTP